MRIIPKIFRNAILPIAGLAALFLTCGGSEVGNPKTITGAVCDPTGTCIADVNLFLIDASNSGPQRLIADSCKKTISGADGSYEFTDVYEGTYDLFGSTAVGDRMFLQKINLAYFNNVIHPGRIFRKGMDTIRPSAKVIVNVENCLLQNENFIFVPGTVIRVPVDSCGEYLVKCPASKIDLLYYRNNSLEILDSNLNLSAGQWLDLTEKSYTVPKPVVISGTVNGIVGRMYLFSADSINLGSNHPVQYRFNWGDSLSFWNFYATAGHIWNKAGTYEVSVQARSFRDTLAVSEWSDSVATTIH
jgi:hypothetical protein